MTGPRFHTERELIARMEAQRAAFTDEPDGFDDDYLDEEWDAVDEMEAREIEEDREYADHLADLREGRL